MPVLRKQKKKQPKSKKNKEEKKRLAFGKIWYSKSIY